MKKDSINLDKDTINLDVERISAPTKKPMPWEDFYELYRQRIVDEHNTLNQRTIWLAISQSFFFGGYAGVANAPKEAKNPIFAGQQDLLLWLIPSAALVACICIFMGVVARSINMEIIRKKFDVYKEKDDNYPPLDATSVAKAMEIFSVWALPLVFIATWIFILIRQAMSIQ